jgi:hypothetical protein
MIAQTKNGIHFARFITSPALSFVTATPMVHVASLIVCQSIYQDAKLLEKSSKFRRVSFGNWRIQLF